MSATASELRIDRPADSRPEPCPASPPTGSAAWWMFYLAPPLLMAFPMAWYGAGLAVELSRAASLLLWGSICLISWALSDVFARALGVAMDRYRLPPWIWLVVGYLLNMAAASVYNPTIVSWLLQTGLADPSPMVRAYFEVERNLLDWDYVQLLYLGGLPGLVYWIMGNFLFELTTGIPRVTRRRPSAAHALVHVEDPAPSPNPAPRFLSRLSRLRGITADQLVAVEAEDHYIQVHTTRGKELILYRFRDALEELASLDGLQIHRSAWVSVGGVQALEGGGRHWRVRLMTGETLKVSLSNRGALRRLRLPVPTNDRQRQSPSNSTSS